MKFKFVDDNEEIIFHMYGTAKNDTMWDMYFVNLFRHTFNYA